MCCGMMPKKHDFNETHEKGLFPRSGHILLLMHINVILMWIDIVLQYVCNHTLGIAIWMRYLIVTMLSSMYLCPLYGGSTLPLV